MSLEAILFVRPHGEQRPLNINNIYPNDEIWYKENNIKVSMEDCGGFFVIYADYGKVHNDDNTPDELLYFVPKNEACEVSLNNIRKMIENERSELST